MNRFLYDIFLALYQLAVRISSPFNLKAKKWVEGRQHVWDELERLQDSGKKRIWFHCASLGEYEQALPLIEKFQNDSEIIITFFSPSGYEIVKKKDNDARVFYLPHDSKANAEKFLDKIKPSLAVFVRYDLWFYYLKTLRQRNIHSILISAVFRKEDVFFQWHGGFFREMLSCFAHIFVQDDDSRKLLSKHGFTNVTKSGDTRIDRVISIQEQARQFPVVERFKGEKEIFLIGSLEPNDEKVMLPVINDSDIARQFKFIIAPHNVSKDYVGKLAQNINWKVVLNSKTNPDSAVEGDVLIIDSIGMLSSLYRYARIAYIGGGFGEGLHNVLEPAAWGIPVFIGPKHQKFLEAVELTRRGGAFAINDAGELKKKVMNLLANQKALEKAGDLASSFINEENGGTQIILDKIIRDKMA